MWESGRTVCLVHFERKTEEEEGVIMETIEKSKTSSFSDPGIIPKGFVYRDHRKRYPWWVKSVDQITVPIDASEIEKPTTNMIIMSIMRRLEDPESPTQRNNIIKKIKSGAPGFSLQDVSLEFASQTYWQAGIDIDGDIIRGFRKLREIIDDQVHTPEELGVEPWQGSEEEASDMIEKAAIHLGAAQVGFTALDLTWLGPQVQISNDVEEPTVSREQGIIFPSSYKYLVVVAGRVPMVTAHCAPGALGSAADRTGYEEAMMAE